MADRLKKIDCKIIDGPSRWHLMQSLFAREELRFRLDGAFKQRTEQFVIVRVRALANEVSQEFSAQIKKLNANVPSDINSSWLVMGYMRVFRDVHCTYAVFIMYSDSARKGLLHAVQYGDEPFEELKLPPISKCADLIVRGQAA